MKYKPVVRLLLEHDLVESEEQAEELIEANRVLVRGIPVNSVSSRTEADVIPEVVEPEKNWVSRGARKIRPFLEKDWLVVRDKVGVDVGASTGGFTEALLQAGARLVYAVDVGYGQLAYRLREDERVVPKERFNFRHAEETDFSRKPEFFTMDVSFISTEKLLPALNKVTTTSACGLLLLKPQFEARREETESGVIEAEKLREEIKERVLGGWQKKGWSPEKVALAPIKGEASGNQEYVVKMQRQG